MWEMTRLKYLEALAEDAKVIEAFEHDPMVFAASPGKVSRSTRKWHSATDEERAEALALLDTLSA
jgi:hypothetical protein